jgi:glycosyltransferase involved in cell wall biosynthesis
VPASVDDRRPDASARPIRVLELRSVRGTGGGPEKTILLGAAGADPSRALVTVCYIRDERDEVFHIDRRAAAAGVEYIEVLERHSFDLGLWARVRDMVRTGGWDVIHSHDYKTDALAWLLARRSGIVPLATAHGWTGHSARERLLYYPAHKRLLARFPLVLAVSSDIRNELLRHGADARRVRVLLNGIDPTEFRREPSRRAAVRAELCLPAEAIVVGAVGRLEPQKRFDILIDAVQRVRREEPRLRLLIAGDGSRRDALQHEIRRQSLEDVVRLLGHTTDVVTLHHAFDIFAQSSDYEGTPNAVLEAMALETPIIATDVGGTAEICRPDVDGLIVAPRDGARLADAIRVVLGDRDGALRRAASARRRVEGPLSFQNRLRALENLYEELTGRARP